MKKILLSAPMFAALALALAAAPLRAETKWQENHPRREQVNNRLNRQNRRIDQGSRNGTLSRRQARQLHREDNHMRREERAMARRNGGHITPAEQRRLNRQENRESRQIYREKH